MLSVTPTTNRAMAHTDIEDTVAMATEAVAIPKDSFIQPGPGGFKVCAGRGCAGATGGEVTVVADSSRPAKHVGD